MTSSIAFSLGFPGIIFLFAVLQTIFLAMVLLGGRSSRSPSNLVLCALVLTFALVLGEFALIEGRVTATYPHLFGISLPGYFLLAPLFYLYTKTLLHRPFSRADAAHLFPAVVGILAVIPFYRLAPEAKQSLLQQLTGRGFDEFPLTAICLMSLISFQTIVYFYRSYALLEAYEAQAKAESASNSIAAVLWLKKMSLGMCAFVVAFYLAAADLFLMYPYSETLLGPHLFSYGLTVFVFFIAWQMYRRPELFALYSPGTLPSPAAASEATEQPRYEKTLLDPEKTSAYQRRLLAYMRQRQPYLDGELRLAQLAEALDMPPHHLSQVINVTQKQSFFEFVNSYRVDHARALLEAGKGADNLLDVALASGFNSKASFNRVFRSATGQTPSAYRKLWKNAATTNYLAR